MAGFSPPRPAGRVGLGSAFALKSPLLPSYGWWRRLWKGFLKAKEITRVKHKPKIVVIILRADFPPFKWFGIWGARRLVHIWPVALFSSRASFPERRLYTLQIYDYHFLSTWLVTVARLSQIWWLLVWVHCHDWKGGHRGAGGGAGGGR